MAKQGIPTEGGDEPPDPIEQDWHPCIRELGINENAPGPAANPDRTGHGFSLGFPATSLMRTLMLAQSRVASASRLTSDRKDSWDEGRN